MKAVFVEKHGGPLEVRETDIPQPGAGEVLIRMAAAPINPSDIIGIRRANADSESALFIPGLEGAGRVVAAGKGLLPHLWMGKRVACSPKHGSGGTWAEYMVTSAGLCFPLGHKVSDEQGSMSLVNPLTALAFIDIAIRGRHRTIINNAAASALGRMVELLCRKHGISLINIVRNQLHADSLRSMGSQYVLNSSDPLFTDQLASLSKQLNASVLFDSVCGNKMQSLIEALPYGSTVVIYGNLSPDDNVMINPHNLLANDIKIMGFFLGNRTKENGPVRNMVNLMKVRRLMSSDMKITIQGRFPLSRVREAIDTYLNNMSAGKVLLIPD
jgi:NADPH:quinone reductase-like Zn-dependent oxidoreductase